MTDEDLLGRIQAQSVRLGVVEARAEMNRRELGQMWDRIIKLENPLLKVNLGVRPRVDPKDGVYEMSGADESNVSPYVLDTEVQRFFNVSLTESNPNIPFQRTRVALQDFLDRRG